MNEGSNPRLRCKSDDIPIIGNSHHAAVWECVYVTVSFRKWCVSSSSPTLLSSTDIRCKAILFYLSLLISLALSFKVRNDSGFPAIAQPKPTAPWWLRFPVRLSPVALCPHVHAGWMAARSDLTLRAPHRNVCVWLQGLPDCWSQSHLIQRKMSRNPSSWKECQMSLTWIGRLKGFQKHNHAGVDDLPGRRLGLTAICNKSAQIDAQTHWYISSLQETHSIMYFILPHVCR